MEEKYAIKMLVASKIEVLDEFEGKKGKFIKTFLINDRINFNGWMTTKIANEKRAKDWLKKPGVRYWSEELQRWDHPEYKSEKKALEGQEDYRVANIIALKFDDKNLNWYQVSEVLDDDIWQKIQTGEIKYVSPSVWPYENIPGLLEPLIATDYGPLHYAFVDEPAFGTFTAIVNGTCDGTTKKCLEELGPLVASIDTRIEKIRTIPIIHTNNSFSYNSFQTKTLEDNHKKEIEEQLNSLKASIEALSAEVKTLKAADEEDEEKQKDAQKTAQTQQSASIKNTEEYKQLKASHDKLESITKQTLIQNALNASRKLGATDEQLKTQSEFMKNLSIDQLESIESKILSPLASHVMETPKNAEFPDLEQLSASTDSENESDEDLMRRAGVM